MKISKLKIPHPAPKGTSNQQPNKPLWGASRIPHERRGWIIGITGGFGTGKSTVREGFRRLGAASLDADAIYHDLIRPGHAGWKRLVKAFGRGILKPDRSIDRKKISQTVFTSPRHRKRLERLTHPLVRREIDLRVKAIHRRHPSRIVAVEIPLLVEANAFRHVDVVVLVVSSRAVQLARLRRKFPSADTQALRKVIASQMSLKSKRAHADWVIANHGSRSATMAQIRRVYDHLLKERR